MAAAPGSPLLWALLPPLLTLCPAQPDPPGSRGMGLSLHPPYFNLAAAASIWATATCGEAAAGGGGRPELYCKLVGGPAAAPLGRAIQGQFCDYCNAADPSKAHPVTNAIDGTERWWQSPPLSMGLKYNEVNVTLDLGQLFHVAYILIKFANSPRPDLWILERSVDFGRTYTPWQFFAHSKADCLEHFGKEANLPVRRDSDVLCTTEYSRILPLENGEIVVSLVNGRPGAKNFTYSSSLREFTKATNIRFHFLRTNTLLGHLISKAQRDPTVTRRYYYSIKDISIGGRCVCHGHAEVCNAKSADNQYQFQCECQHNTCGETCDHCCPGYNQKQWQPATAGSTNTCEPCNCHGHATDCYYDADVDHRRESLNIHGHYEGGGVCINCQHNTAGINCEKCAGGYYRPYGVPVRAPDGCIPCSCNSERAEGCEEGSGRCFCKQNFQGENCERCADGFYDYPFCVRIPVYPFTSPNPRDGMAGDIIEGGCKPGYFGPQCLSCQCHGAGVLGSDCDVNTGQCRCRTGFQGFSCDTCAPGYFHYPFCQVCKCNVAGTQPEVCDFLGMCLCRSGVAGLQCDSCQPGHHSFPACPECNCDAVGSVENTCGPRGQCLCRSNYAGLRCDQCAPGYYSYPSCLPCHCSPDGSQHGTCDPTLGQCECQTGVTGRQCNRCLSAADSFPYCKGVNSECDPSGSVGSHSGYCQCLQHVEGPTCSKCKPLYWKLAKENPEGCTACQCDVSGTLSGVGECQQENGHCYCKSNVCGNSCDTCEAGYYALENKNYFGCQGCRCDVGGSLSPSCAEPLGGCQCRAHVVGTDCREPEKNYFFPDLHHMKFEIEDGTTVKGREIRFGYDPQEFPSFSWRGYAQMSSIQNEVRITLNVEKSNLYLFRIILRYINPGGETLSGHISACQSRPETGAAQSKEFAFPPSKEPAFVTIPGKSSTEPFSLVPGTWTVSIMAEEVLLDYMVLLPSDYYEATILQIQVTEPCTYSGRASTEHCLLYQHLPLGRFSCVLGSEAAYLRHGGEYRRLSVRQPTPDQPVMTHISGREVNLQMTINVPQVGRYVLVFEYANEEERLHTAEVIIHSPGPVTEGRVRIYSCKYSFLCRSVVVDDRNRIAVYDLLADTKIDLKASSSNFLLHKVCIISAEEFSPEYVDPRVQCIAAYRSTRDGSATCIPSVYKTPPAALVLDAFKDGKISEVRRNILSDPLSAPLPSDSVNRVTLTPLQNQITLRGRVPRLGRYVFVVHFYQPAHPVFPVQVRVEAGHVWSGSFNASFCPHTSGCRDQVIAENRIELDISEPEVSVTVMIPDGTMLVLENVLVVPADTYSYKILDKKTVDKSFDFISQCGRNSFYIDPEGSSAFCKDSVRSLVAFYNNGALPCNCHSAGATSPTCSPLGGQCICRPNVIGRQCSRCRSGYYGFPFCKLCNCGQRLCDDMTGKCICPPRTVKPKCEVCQKHYFSYHPLAGCESCNCSERGVVNVASPECEKTNGQCKCKPGIKGRRCDQCAPGTYGFPNCMPCNCSRDGTEPDVCDPQTGICLCKENVEGAECDTCRPGCFYLDPSNPRGCTSCFCFGATSNCRSTTRRRTKFVDMRNWRLEAVDEYIDIPVTFNPVSNSVVADVQELPASVHSLYWKAPPSYLGEKLSSYGGFLSYQVKSFGLPSEGMVLLDKRPDIQLTGQQMEVVYMDPNNPLPDRQYYGRVQLVEGNFRHASSNNLVSREELMIILSRLDGLYIRGLYFTETQRLTLGEVGLEEATSAGSGSIAYSVETCSCPPEYAGDSCQECGLGFYRETKGLLTGRCVPCNCNGNSNRCQDGTGKCINCQYNTAGEKCERCKDGYFGDATQGSCRVCPCPYTNRFATGCVANGEEIQCLCKEGYTGVRCERCAPGYFGNPQKYGGYCQKCNCNNNGQLASCDRLTGECFNNEPKDVDPNEDCDPCDSCVITLLKDLSTIGDELQLIKSQLQNVYASTHTLEQMRRLETRIKDLKVLLNNYRSVVRNQGSKVDELETEFINLNHDINALQEKAEINYKAAEILFNNFGQTHQKGKDLVSRIQIVVNNIQVLLEQIAGTNEEGNNLPLGDAAKELAEAQRMMMEMRNRNFGQLQAEAEKERTEAQLLLARIKNELQKHHQENHGLIKIVRDSLNEYESKITDLREALNEATGQIKQAENLNRDNGVLLDDIKKRIEEANVHQKGILDILSSARSSLTQANSVLGLLQKSKEEYESLAAQLDGARKDMNEKLTNHSLSASKEPLVVRAEEHAKSLQDLAKQLEEIKNSARKDELVGCAVEASTAYDNIINAIKAAEEAANKAGNAADSALSTVKREDLSGKAAKLKTESSTLLNQAQETERTLQAIGPTLEDIKQRLSVADGKKNTLQIDLVTLQNNLNGINRDDIDSIITSAKNMVKRAKDVTNNVLDELLPIQADVEKMKSTYGSTQSAGFSKALMEANNSVKKLTNKLPDLFSKIESINQQLMPISNISENVNRIRELIQQARDAANKVAIPMRFNGSSGVEVRPPSNLEDLKGYTSLSFFLQRPETRLDTSQRASNKFVLYLGNKDASKDYIGMAVKDGHLTCVYNLGDGDVEIDVQPFVTQSETEEAVMDQVKFERIYQYVRLNYIKAATSTSPDYASPLTASSGGSDTLLNLDPSTVVFYVGGYPPDFRPPQKLDYPHYEGCIELDNLNEHIISLYNFKRTFNLNTTEVQPCRRYKEETDQSYFEGTGYASVTLKEPNTHSRVRYEQTIETTADEGIVFFAANGDQFISVLIKDGHTVFRYKVGSEPPKEIETNATVNDGTYKQIHLVLARSRNTVHVSPDIKANINVFVFTKYYLGGIPPSLRERFNISTPPFRGCMKNVKNPNTASVIFDETVGVSKKCSDDWKLIRSAAFSKKGTLSLSAAGFPFPKDFQVGFGFQTMASTGTLLNYNLWPNILTIFLRPGFVIAKMGEKEIELKKKYEDGSMHYVTVIKTDNRVHLLVDDESALASVDSPRARALIEPIKFGGDNFEGCISNIFIKRAGQLPEVQNLINYTAKTGVSLGACRKYENLEPMLLKEFKNPLRFKMLKVQNEKYLDYLKAANVQNQQTQTLPTELNVSSEAYLLGNIPNSFISYMFSPPSSTDRLHFSVDVRTRSSRGLIVFMEERSEDSYMALLISKGHFVFSLGSEGKRIKIKTSIKYNDGQWHTVVFSTDGKNVRLVVDGLRAQHRRLETNSAISIKPPIYVGGLPSLKRQKIAMNSFKGCLRNFKMNGKVMNAPQQKNGVLPCLDVPMDTGIYFFNEGGYITIGNLVVGLDFRIVFTIRPRSSTGILLHAGSKQDNYLTVYMEGGKVIAAGNSGAGAFQTSVTPKQPLSDGQWHTIAVSQKQNTVQLEVGTQSNYTTGLPPSPPRRVRQPLYFGKIPANLDTLWLPVKDPFFGCLRNININDKHVSTRRISDVHGVVSLYGCPAK
ncbi:laminin subunit alpha-3 isoform X2 [Harpia harpyja]|uniref:laminin subunit alpha-3 isoform X2 n=1 Tax=Harpia harpyja TaxID=202280 RepID=UPI0022B0DE10|nr:laminin subunit alpha-3 isoform X2 [Harpia harpyja]